MPAPHEELGTTTPNKYSELDLRLNNPNLTPDNFIYPNHLNTEQIDCYVDNILKFDNFSQKKFQYFYQNDLAFNLAIDASDNHPILISEPNKTNKHYRKAITELFFEEKLTTSLFLCKKAMLSLYSCGKSNGVVLDSGAYSTTLTPIEEGYVLQQGITSSNFGGEDITRLLVELLLNKGCRLKPLYLLDTTMGIENMDSRIHESFIKYHIDSYARQFKHDHFKFCSKENMYQESQEYKLPDGTHVS